MDINYIDIHSHLNFPEFDADRDDIIARMQAEGIMTIAVGTDIETSRAVVALAEKHPNIFATVGVHPTHDGTLDPEAFGELAKNEKVVAVGECGLDYFRDASQKERQKELFIKHVEFADAHDLPLMIHGRPSKGSTDAYEDILEILSMKLEAGSSKLRGNIHFFVGPADIAKRFLDLGFTLSFDGPITFSHDYDETIKSIPSDMIMAETDAPFAAPAPHRGKRNEPAYVAFVVDALAEIRGEDKEKLKQQLILNAIRVFGLPKTLA